MKQALLIIDVQRGLFDKSPRPFDADNVIRRINSLTARARRSKTPVIFIQHESVEKPLVWNSESWKLERNLEVAAQDQFVRKTTPDSFLKTNLQEILDAVNVKQLIICGYATEFCVDTTVRRAAGLGYSVILASDAHMTHDKAHATSEQIRAHHNATLPSITSFGSRIEAIDSDTIRLEPVEMTDEEARAINSQQADAVAEALLRPAVEAQAAERKRTADRLANRYKYFPSFWRSKV
jgi:nicotinamidase-related amidase